MSTNIEKTDDPSSSPPISMTKQSIRRQVWEYLEKNNLVNFPRPVYGRIPNFKGCEEAASKITQLDDFKHAQNIKVNPDKPQEPVRYAVLENQKNLFVPVPRLASGLLKHVILPENPIKDDLRRVVSRKGIDTCGKEIGLEDSVTIDLVVLGSVAVSKEGYRIGKGKGYADLEFAILKQMKAVTAETVIITTVHDSQIFDTLPSELFGPHDVPVDIIVSPTQIILIEKRLPKPSGIFWGLISQRKLELMPILKALRDLDEISGKDVSLKQVESDVENRPPNTNRNFQRTKRIRVRHSAPDLPPKIDTGENIPENNDQNNRQPPRRRRIIRRRPKPVENSPENVENIEKNVEESPKRRSRRQVRKNRSRIDFSLVVRNIEKNVRVRDLKAALAERGIKPNIITWQRMKGYCCLHFSKTNPNTISNVEENSHGVDNVLGKLQNLKIKDDSEPLSIEIMKPISRIETTDVTAV